MSELSRHREDERVERPNTVANSQPAFRHVMACVDTSALARKVIPHAVAIAKAMEAALTLVRVLEPGPTGEGPPDPVEWDIRRHQARDHLAQLVQEQRDEAGRIEVEVVEGHPAEKISLWARDHRVDLTVLATHVRAVQPNGTSEARPAKSSIVPLAWSCSYRHRLRRRGSFIIGDSLCLWTDRPEPRARFLSRCVLRRPRAQNSSSPMWFRCRSSPKSGR